jgi:hypothetical protein
MKYIIISFIIILAIFLIVLSQIPTGIEPLTEVYFENHTKLPKYLFLEKEYDFDFTIHNLEHQKMGYVYYVDIIEEDGSVFQSESGYIILEHDESETIHSTINFPQGFTKAKTKITVKKLPLEEPEFQQKLWWPDPNYPTQINIHFLTEEITPTTITITED